MTLTETLGNYFADPEHQPPVVWTPRAIETTGRIGGRVYVATVTRYSYPDRWTATVHHHKQHELGDFTTEAQARVAVERWISDQVDSQEDGGA